MLWHNEEENVGLSSPPSASAGEMEDMEHMRPTPVDTEAADPSHRQSVQLSSAMQTALHQSMFGRNSETDSLPGSPVGKRAGGSKLASRLRFAAIPSVVWSRSRCCADEAPVQHAGDAFPQSPRGSPSAARRVSSVPASRRGSSTSDRSVTGQLPGGWWLGGVKLKALQVSVVLAVGWQCISLPAELVWGLQLGRVPWPSGWSWVHVACDVVLWADIALAFRTPILLEGQMVHDARHLLRSHLLFEIIGTLPVGYSSKGVGWAQLLRLLLLGKLRRSLAAACSPMDVQFLPQAHGIGLRLRLLQLSLMAFLVLHWYGCAWCALLSSSRQLAFLLGSSQSV